MKKIKILWISDAVVPTGWSTVAHSIIKYLPEQFEVHHLGINYYGDPHQYKHAIYPASIRGDIYGINRLQEFAEQKFDMIFLLNDLWIIDMYLENIKKIFKEIPKIVLYFPVDAENFDEDWFRHFDIVTQAYVYTKFGQDVVTKAFPDFKFGIVPHGVDHSQFFKLPNKKEVKAKIYPDKPEFQDNSFVVLNAN